MESEIIQNPFYHYTYVFDKNTGNLEYPDVYLLSKGLHKLGQLYPINELNIVVKANDADEVSFTFHKYVNDTEQELYDKVKTDSVIYIKGFGCFQLKVNENDKGEGVYKSVSGESLADVELSNILATLEINTEQDILVSDYENENVTDYIPTVFFRDESKYDDYTWSTGNSKLSDNEKKQKLKDSSLLHRIFSYAPHYEIGHVDESLYYVQRDFSWSNSYIKDILNDVAEEVGCIFTFETYLDDNGKTVRKVNAYDISYCEKCYQDAAMQLSYKTFDVSKFRSITNGICDNCGSSKYVYDYGKDTDIFITTENLTDEISVQPENEIKNVLKISGGDDNITSAIQALNMGSSKIMMFSEETKNEMSDELRKKFEDYINDQSSIATSYETLVETQSNVYDLIQYLQSGKMPQLADNARDIQEEVKYLLNSITEDYENNFYVESYDKGEKSFLGHEQTVSSSSIKNLFTLYLDKGYSVRVSNGDIGDKTNPNDSYVRWDGIITIYETSNSDNYADIHCSKSDTTYVVYNQITAQNSDGKLQETYNSFYVNLMFTDQDSVKYASYIQQFCEQKLASYKKVEYKNEEEKPWNEYCYERLKSFYDGYQACLEVLSEMDSQQTIQSVKQVISDIYNNYSLIQDEISQQMKILVQQINALYRYLGEYTYDTDKYGKRTYSPDYVSEDYVVDYKNALSYLANPSMTKYFIGTKPIACKKCGSSNVGIAKNDSGKEYNYCLSCGNTDSSLLVTYADIAKQVSEQCNKSESNLLKDITEIRNKFKIENYFGELYSELLPYIKEQEYSNSNYTSDACNTNQDIIAKAKELLQKARKELYKACEQQYSVSADVFSIVAERWKNWDVNTKYHDMYDKFSLGNWMRVRLDKTIKKLRLISITFDFDTVDKMSVEFSDVIQVGNVLSDINSVLQQASSISSTYNYVTDQAKQGSEANVEINKILQNGLDSAYSAVMAGDNQEITMDRHGLLFRKFLDELDDYSKYQMKMINRNIVMTDDGWKSAKLAIGLGMLPDGTYGYGIWADNIIGGKVNVTENLTIGNSSKSVEITSDGIVLDGGAITWKNPLADGSVPQSSVSGLPGTLESLSEDIEQLDGRIQTYSQSDDPSTSWNEDEKSKHKGDIWFNPSDGLTKRWDGTKWDVVTDSSLVALAQSKGQIFTTQPTPPYNVGDLWIGNNKSDLLRCQTPKKLDEKFDIKDWIVGVKYTDDTALQEMLTSISADDKLSVAEKSYIKKQMDEIAKEYDSIKARAERYSIWSTLTSYQTAYTNLNNYISPLLSKMDEVSSITKSTFDNKFSDYYTELGVVNGLIDVAVQSAAESTASKDLNAYKQEVDEFKELVDNNLSLIGVTKVGSNYIYSPKIAGGYAYFTKGNYSVEIDPNHSADNNTLNGYLFAIRDKSKSNSEQIIMGVDTSGNGTFSGEIKADSGNIGGWNIDSGSLKTTTNAGIYQFKQGTNGFPCMRIIDGKATFSSYVSKISGHFDDSQYIDISNQGIYAKNPNTNEDNSLYSFAFNNLDNTFTVNCDSCNLYAETTISGETTISKHDLLIDNDYYISSSSTWDGVHASIIGRSSSGNIYVGMYYYGNSHHPEYTTNILLSALNVSSLGTFHTPDGTVSTSDERLKTDICDIGSSEIDFILGLKAKKYKLKNGTSGRYHYGFIAQPVKELMDKTIGDVGLIVKSEKLTSEDPNYVPIDFGNEDTYYYGLRYEEFIAPMVKTIQYQQKEIERLEERISVLEEQIQK